VMITGMLGYIGTVLAKELLGRGHSVFGIDSLIYEQDYAKTLQQLPSDQRRLNFEILDTRNIAEIKRKIDINRPDVLVHLGDLSSVYACNHNPKYTKDVGVESTKAILAECHLRGIPFVYNSSSSVYGVFKDKGLATEETPLPEPTDLYTTTKLEIESFLHQLRICKESNFICFRPATVFGVSPRFRVELLPNHFAFSGVSRKLIRVSNLNAYRAFISVSDLASIYVDVLEANFFPGEIFNIGAYNLSKLQVALAVQNNVECKIETMDDIGDMRNLQIDSSRFFDAFKQYNFDGFENKIKELVNWLKDNHSEMEDTNFVGLLNMPLANWRSIL